MVTSTFMSLSTSTHVYGAWAPTSNPSQTMTTYLLTSTVNGGDDMDLYHHIADLSGVDEVDRLTTVTSREPG
jgi:hypothetical protein